MNDDVLYIIGFAGINAVFLATFPYYIGLNAATNLRVPYRDIDVWPYLFCYDRLLIAASSIIIFTIFVVIFNEDAIALCLGFLVSAVFVGVDYKRIYGENRRKHNIED